MVSTRRSTRNLAVATPIKQEDVILPPMASSEQSEVHEGKTAKTEPTPGVGTGEEALKRQSSSKAAEGSTSGPSGDKGLESPNLELDPVAFRKLLLVVFKDVIGNKDLQIEASYFDLIQQAVEADLVRLLKDTDMCAAFANRITIKPEDMYLARGLRGNWFHI